MDERSGPTETSRTRVVLFGVGTVGTATLDLCRRRQWIDVVGAIRGPEKRRSGSLERPTAWDGVELWTDPDAMLDDTAPAIALIATRSPLAAVMPDIERCARRGIHVICTSEELAWPDVEKPGEGQRLHHYAADAGVTIVATGINPGFVFDALPVMLAGAAWDVQSIRVERVLDASVFGQTVHRSLGIGYHPEEFQRAVASREVRGHIGFAESANAIAAAMGVEIEDFTEHLAPVPAEQVHELREYRIEPPTTAGVTQVATATSHGREWLRFDLSLHVAPDSVGWETHDRIHVVGDNDLDLTIAPGAQAVLTTAARLVNTIPAALVASPGFYPASRLLPNPPWLADRAPL